MKNIILFTACVFLCFQIQAQQLAEPQVAEPGPSANSPLTMPPRYEVGERGPHHRVWHKITTATNSLGEAETTTNIAYVELATGLHYQKNGQWRDSQEGFELVPGWAVARKGSHKVSLAYNLNLSGSVVVELPDGQMLRSHVVGLAYLDNESHQSVVLGYLKDCGGKLVATNQIIYEDAFSDVKADVRYTYRKSGLEQDVILRQSLPDPQKLGLNPETTLLAVFTEFDSGPAPEVRVMESRSDQDASTKTTDAESGVNDSDIVLQFGEMQMGKGKAFILGEDRPELRKQVPVLKKWLEIQGRKFLFEEVPLPKIKADLDSLPKQSSVKPKKWNKTAVAKLQLPRVRGTQPEPRMFEVASAGPQQLGYVLDYVTLGAGLTNYTFAADITYYISGTVNLYGTNTFEGGTVLKFNPTNYHALNLNGGTVVCKTGPYRPVVFTSQNDNTAGATISGSTGSPSAEHIDSYYLVLYTMTNASLSNLRMSYGNCSFTAYNCSNIVVSDLQILHSDYAIYPSVTKGLHLRNALIYNTGDSVIWNDTSSVTVEHMTVNQSVWFGFPGSFSGMSIAATNCLLVGISSLGDVPLTTNYVTVVSSSNGVFQVAGAGYHYLAAGSPYRDVGTTGIDSQLWASLQRKTTFAPTLLTNTTVNSDVTLSPQVARDTDSLDLGYHYDPIDYITDYYGVTNATLTINPDTVIAGYNSPGIWLKDSSQLLSLGAPDRPVWLVRYNTAQEQGVALGAFARDEGMPVNAFSLGSSRPSAAYRFTKFACLANSGYHLYNVSTFIHYYAAGGYSNLTVTGCEFYGGGSSLRGFEGAHTILWNNLFFRGGLDLFDGYAVYNTNVLSVYNNLFWQQLGLNPHRQNSDWYFYNNAFAACTFLSGTMTLTNNGNNAYILCNTNLLPLAGTNIFLTNQLAWQGGPLGDCYQPTNSPLLNFGSTNANFLGLYHYTTTTNQVKETNTVVDIGYHYVAVDANGGPIDTDGDGIVDYVEDVNGNGAYDAAIDVANWLSLDSDGDGRIDEPFRVRILSPH